LESLSEEGRLSSEATTFYPGVGADQAIDELHNLVGQITANWATIEDQLFNVFVIAVAGTGMVPDLRTYRAVFFTFPSYEGKMRMTHNAMKARYGLDTDVMGRWKTIREAINNFSALRNEVAHLIPMLKSSADPNAKANVRLVPAFWKNAFSEQEFDSTGYSADELWQALKPYLGYHPRISIIPPSGEEAYQLGYRIQQFAFTLASPHPSPPSAPSGL